MRIKDLNIKGTVTKRLRAVPTFSDPVKQLEWRIHIAKLDLEECTSERQRSTLQQKIGRYEREIQQEKVKQLIGANHGTGTTVPSSSL